MVNENAGEEIEVYDGSDARANSLARVKLALKYEQKRVRTSTRGTTASWTLPLLVTAAAAVVLINVHVYM